MHITCDFLLLSLKRQGQNFRLTKATKHDADVCLYESIKKTEEATRGGGQQPFTEKQLETVIDHLIKMMAETHFRALPDKGGPAQILGAFGCWLNASCKQ